MSATRTFAGHEQRIVPIVPRLAALFWAAYEEAPQGQVRVMTLSKNNLSRSLKAAIKRAKVTPWEDLFQNLRRSCEIEWAQHFPQFAVSKWLGHSMAVSAKHYANIVPDELFDRASAGGGKAAQKAAQQMPEMTGNEQKTPPAEKCEENGNAEESPVSCDSGNPGGGIRTHDQGIMSPRL